ncbi:MAG TPA: Flp family type IVb pilin [Actinomycetota bacterium]|jgi:Flp pilus assembly pilin Flp
MERIREQVGRIVAWGRCELGAVAAEYGLILTLVVIVTVLAITAFGIAVVGMIDEGSSGFPSGP